MQVDGTEAPRIRVMGVDPGTVKFGWAVADYVDGEFKLLNYDTITAPQARPMPYRLALIFREIVAVMKPYKPTDIAIEDGFIGRNPRTGMAIGFARALAMLASQVATDTPMNVHLYKPAEVKLAATGQGNARKEFVQSIVRSSFVQHLSMAAELTEDAADAVAVALCYCNNWEGQQRALRIDRP